MKIADFPTEQQLRGMSVSGLKSHIKEFNMHYAIKGYSKLRKDQLIS